ncbi:MAG TPA: ABC transporter ATP-binding protein [Candidatus Methylomirabilis sp.]|jgi:phospholipid/cholesterol/gamma-HCH transport system ATP-binding protein
MADEVTRGVGVAGETAAPAEAAGPPGGGRPVAEFRGVRKVFGRLQVLDGLDLQVRPRETVTIIGGSGTGKTVILKLMVGLLKPEAGQILVEGEDIVPLSEEQLIQVRRGVGFLFQGGALFDSLTVGENVAYPLREHTRMDDTQVEARVREVLGLVGLDGIEAKAPAALSGGMRKRVGLARAIALAPHLILYDEPTTGLDPQNAEKINELIRDLQRKLGVTSVVVTHDMHSAFKVSDRIAMLRGGRIAALGAPAELQRSTEEFVQDFIAGRTE